jgi:hypothetical protein
MKFILPFLFLFLSCFSAFAQRFYPSGIQSRTRISLNFGSATYMGDLQEEQLIATTPNAGLTYEYQLNPRWGVRADGLAYRLSAKDANSMDPARNERNLSFFSTNYELSGSFVLYLFKKLPAAYSQRKPVNIYALIGFGGTYFNPKTIYKGNTYALRDYQTEGVAYSKISPVIPSGMGVTGKLSTRLDLAMEVTYRLTFTDYLDDVSRNYPGPKNFASEITAELSDRRQEGGYEPMAAGSRRGNPALKDGYALYNVRVIYYLNSMYYSATDKRKRLAR